MICTRAQAVMFLWNAAGNPTPKTTDNPFVDVSEDAYYYQAMLWAVGEGITVGTSNNCFSPDMIATRSQIVSFLYRYAGSPAVENAASFTDVPVTAYYADAVAWAMAEGVTEGTGNNCFSPLRDCTRAEMCASCTTTSPSEPHPVTRSPKPKREPAVSSETAGFFALYIKFLIQTKFLSFFQLFSFNARLDARCAVVLSSSHQTRRHRVVSRNVLSEKCRVVRGTKRTDLPNWLNSGCAEP